MLQAKDGSQEDGERVIDTEDGSSLPLLLAFAVGPGWHEQLRPVVLLPYPQGMCVCAVQQASVDAKAPAGWMLNRSGGSQYSCKHARFGEVFKLPLNSGVKNATIHLAHSLVFGQVRMLRSMAGRIRYY